MHINTSVTQRNSITQSYGRCGGGGLAISGRVVAVRAAAVAAMNLEARSTGAVEVGYGVWVRVADAVVAQALDESGFTQEDRPLAHPVVAWVVDWAKLPRAGCVWVDIYDVEVLAGKPALKLSPLCCHCH